MKNTINKGRVAKVVALIKWCQAVPASSVNNANPTGKVIKSRLLIKINGYKNSSQFVTNVKIVKVANEGTASGIIICANTLILEQPSITAASSNSFGTTIKNCLIKNTPKAPGAPNTGKNIKGK